MTARQGRECVILFNPRSTRGLGNFAAPFGLLMASVGIHQSYSVFIIDQTVQKDWRERLLEKLAQAPLCLGITAMTGPQIREGLLVAKLAKERGCPVVWGGLHASLQPEQTVAHPLVDYVVEGEGEIAFAELVNALACRAPVSDIPSVWSKTEGTVRHGGKRALAHLDDLPPIPFHLIEMEHYVKPSPYGPAFTLFTSRGCPQHCTFCINETMYASCWRAFPTERVLADVRLVLQRCPSVTHIQFWDDSFFPSFARVTEIAEGLMALDRPVSWSVLGTHVRDITRMSDEYLAFLANHRLREVIVGAESGSQRIIDMIRKNFRVEELLEANRRLAVHGIRPTYSFISGIPGETDEDLRKTTALMFQLKQDNAQAIVGNIKPSLCYPGTAHYQDAVSLGFKPPERLDDWSEFLWGNYAALEMPWVPPRRKRMLQHLYYYTVLLNPVYPMIDSRVFPVLASLLGPIARWRVKHLNFAFPFTAKVMHLIQRYFL